MLLTDGRQEALPPRDMPAQDIAGRLRHQGYPVFPWCSAQSRGLGGVQDVAVVDFPTPAAVFVKTDMAIHGEVKISGYVNKEIPVRLFMGRSKNDDESRPRNDSQGDEDGQIVPVDFTYTPETPGEYKLTLEAVAQPGELVTTNNQQSAFVQVLKGGLHVLYIEGTLRAEEKWLRMSLDSSRDIKLDSIRIDPRHKETRPGDFAEIAQAGQIRRLHPRRPGSRRLRAGRTRAARRNGQPRQGPDRARRLPQFRPRRVRRNGLAKVLPVKMDHYERQPWTARPARTCI